jgi:hypothetical protein
VQRDVDRRGRVPGEAWSRNGGQEGRREGRRGSRAFAVLDYGLSLPERTVRSTVALAAGTAAEAAKLLVPHAFQDSKTYEILVQNSLRFLTDEIGGAKTGAPDAAADGTEYMARKAVGNFVDMAGVLTLHLSPLWFLAAFSDIAYGSKTYLRELAEELKKQGLIDEGSAITRADDLLEAVQKASGRAAGLLDTPPLSVDQLKQSLNEIRQAVGSADYAAVLPQQELSRYWDEMRQIAQREKVSLLEVSTALTLHSLGKLGAITKGAFTGLRVAGGMLNRTVIAHYTQALSTLREKGFYAVVSESYGPYVEAVWQNFAEERKTLTEELVTGRLLKSGVEKVRGWLRPGHKEDAGPGKGNAK